LEHCQMTVGEFQRSAEEALATLYEPQERRAILRRWLSDRMGFEAHELVLAKTETLTDTHQLQLQEDLAKLLARVPIQYVLGWEDFAGLRLRVGPGVLIPRPETEELVTLALSLPLPESSVIRVLDLGTGSGCIALALAHARPDWQVTGFDISPEALTIAQHNADSLRLPNVHFRTLDLLEATPEQALDLAGGSPNLLVSNPPYVPLAEAPTLEAHVRDHEPHLALFAPDDDPLIFYRRLIALSAVLVPGGWLVLETHSPLAAATIKLAESAGLQALRLIDDQFARPRFVVARRPESTSVVA
jgi:release factor glutamine methyltransferase